MEKQEIRMKSSGNSTEKESQEILMKRLKEYEAREYWENMKNDPFFQQKAVIQIVQNQTEMIDCLKKLNITILSLSQSPDSQTSSKEDSWDKPESEEEEREEEPEEEEEQPNPRLGLPKAKR